MTEADRRTIFVKEWLREPDKPFVAAQKAFPGPENFNEACRISIEWVRDPAILALRDKMLEEQGERAFLPTKEQTARELWEMQRKLEKEPRDRLATIKLFAEVMGYVEKPGGSAVNVNVTQNRVMVVRRYASDEEWEKNVAKNQAKLVSDTVH